MTKLPTNSGSQPSAGEGYLLDWQNIIWREWCNCEDETYALHLFNLVIDEPIGQQAMAISALLGASVGSLGGWLIIWLLYWEDVSLVLISTGIILGMIAGSVGGLLVGFGMGQRVSWSTWLKSLIPDELLIGELKGVNLTTPYFKLVIGLGSGLGVGITGALFFDQANRQFYNLLVGLIGLSLAAFDERKLSTLLVNILLAGLVGLFLGLFFGLGFAQIAGQILGSFDLINSARVVGLTVGIGVSLLYGRAIGLIGVLIWQIGATAMVLIGEPNLVLLSWLFGLLLGGVVGSLSRKWDLSEHTLKFAHAYKYRAWYKWWYNRPLATEVEVTLRHHATEEVWEQPLYFLTKERAQLETAEALWNYLRQPYWVARFVGRCALITLGGEALTYLLAIAKNKSHPLQRTAIGLIHNIAHETRIQLAAHADHLLCPNCLTICGSHPARWFRQSVTYYGCRTCRQSRQFLQCPQGVVAVLDIGWAESQCQQDGLLQVNWLVHRALFDFDRVEIIQATDEEVERFVMQVGNDTDPFREGRYQQMRCNIAPACQLSENTLRILKRTFGAVEIARLT